MSRHPIRSQTQAALDALRDELSTVASADATEMVLELFGDGLRAGAIIPVEITRWTERLGEISLGAGCDHLAELLGETLIPAEPDDVDALSVAAVVRDRAESMALAVRRACIGTSRDPEQLPGFRRLLDTKRAFDQALAAVAGRQQIERALGERRGLLLTTSWTDGLAPDASTGATPADAGRHIPVGLIPEGRPSLEQRMGYLESGVGAAWIERYAARDEEFADDLRGDIEMLREEAETVSLVARRWEKGQRPRAGGSTGAAVLRVPVRLAAASDSLAPQSTRLQLGLLHPTPAEAWLEITAEAATLHVHSAAGMLQSVTFGTTTRAVAAGAEETQVTAALADAPWLIAVVAADNTSFDFELTLDTSPS